MKQETLEEAAKKYINDDLDLYESLVDGHISYNIGIDLINKLFIAGAKHQQEQDKNKYSEEDLKIAFDAGESFGSLPFSSMSTSNRLSKKEWFEQFKKK